MIRPLFLPLTQELLMPRDIPGRTETKAQQVARNFKAAIQSGKLRHGEVLPSQRKLRDAWGVSQSTIVEAMRLLASEGLIRSAERSRRVVHAPDQDRPNRTAVTPDRPVALLVGGYAGSGKTELGRILARRTGWPLLDKDTTTRPVVEMALEVLGSSPHDRESAIYLNKVRGREYEALMMTTQENIECGNSVIVTAPFLRELTDARWLERTRSMLARSGAILEVVWVNTDVDTMHAYLRHRSAARDAHKLSNWDEYVSKLDLTWRPTNGWVVDNSHDTDVSLQDQATELIKTLS